jgi:hypothetical protein
MLDEILLQVNIEVVHNNEKMLKIVLAGVLLRASVELFMENPYES